MTYDINELIEICATHAYEGTDVVVREPYVPYFPKSPHKWNGILVLAVAQNLANSAYREWLKALTPADRCNRLDLGDIPVDGIGIGPWDDGTMKLCVAALRGVETVEQVAVSNAVLWSGPHDGTSESLSKEAKAASVNVWRQMLEVLNPTEVITFGAVAREVMKKAGGSKEILHDMPGPFSRNWSTSFKMDVRRLLSAFPEVQEALSDQIQLNNEAMAIHCACDCVSRELGSLARRPMNKQRGKNVVFCPDADPMNADWPKRTWDLPPYKSEEFMRFLQSSGTTLEDFRKLPVYVFAVQKGAIVDDKWVGRTEERGSPRKQNYPRYTR